MSQQAIASANSRRARASDVEHLKELLFVDTPARSPAPATTPAPAAAEVQPAASNDLAYVPQSRNDIFKRYAAYEAAITAAAHAQFAVEHAVLGFGLTTRPSTDGIEEVARQAINIMIREAQNRFSNRYTTLVIETSAVLAATGQEDWREVYRQTPARVGRGKQPVQVHTVPEIPVDLDKIWAYLENTYGGEAGQIALYRQLAPMLISRLHLNDKDMRRTASAVIAYQSISSRPASFGSKTGPYTIYDRENVNVVFDALSHVFGWAGLDALSLALKPDRHKIGDYTFKFDSREKFSFPGLDVVAFKDSFDYKFSHEAAAKLQLFLGSFGT